MLVHRYIPWSCIVANSSGGCNSGIPDECGAAIAVSPALVGAVGACGCLVVSCALAGYLLPLLPSAVRGPSALLNASVVSRICIVFGGWDGGGGGDGDRDRDRDGTPFGA